MRNGAVGLSSCFARVGGMVAPYVAEAVSHFFFHISFILCMNVGFKLSGRM